jgi:pentose-5-phosphate-3-epimerase
MKFVPALLTPTMEEFSEQMGLLLPHFDHFSIDIQDGKFVPSSTISTADLISYFETHQITKDKIFDFDLMTYDYEKSIKDIEAISQYVTVRNIFVHFSLLKEHTLPSHNLFTIGIALNPPDTIEVLALFGGPDKIPTMQIMTIYAGAQGQVFMPEMLKKVSSLKRNNYRFDIFIDGGVNATSLPLIIKEEFPPDFICVGSYLSKAGEELPKRIEYLHSIER